MECDESGKKEKMLSELASSLISPIATFYALWLLREAVNRGVKRLYFVARDGYVVKKIADALVSAFGMEVELRYLYGSRQAWHIPAITEFSAESLSWLFERTRAISVRIILGRLQTAPEQMHETLSTLGWPPSSWDRCLDEKSLQQLSMDVLGCEAFRRQIESLVQTKRQVAIEYLEQEGLFDSTPFAIVDLGWHGRLQLSLEKLLNIRTPTKTLGLYFGLFSDSPALKQLKTASFLNWDLRIPPESKDIPSLVFLMESFCTAPHGSTIGYNRDANGKVIPLFQKGGIEELEKWGIATVHRVIDRYAEHFKKLALIRTALDWDTRPAVVRMLGAFSRGPLASEARAWGRNCA
jgi:predicted HAD superfamily hydrolase